MEAEGSSVQRRAMLERLGEAAFVVDRPRLYLSAFSNRAYDKIGVSIRLPICTSPWASSCDFGESIQRRTAIEHFRRAESLFAKDRNTFGSSLSGDRII